MDHIKILEEFHPEIEQSVVFRQLNCSPDSASFGAMEEAFQEMIEEMMEMCTPRGIMALGKIPASYQFEDQKEDVEAIYVLVTVGQAISDYSTRMFQEGDYVKGMLADAMADAALFSLEADIKKELKKACAEWKRGVKKRLEAPQDIAMTIQKEAFLQTGAGEQLGMELTQGYMFRPLKTSSQIYVTTEDMEAFRVQHNCRTCPNVTCMLRHIEPLEIRVLSKETEIQKIHYMEGTLLDALCSGQSGVHAPCGGRGSCGKCRIQVTEGKLPVTDADRRSFSEEELEAGWRLACQAVPMEELTVRIGWKNETEMEAVADFSCGQASMQEDMGQTGGEQSDGEGMFGFAIDIGTTTLAVQLISLKNAALADTVTSLNSQRIYGGDVIARIQASIEGKGRELCDRLRTDLWNDMETLRKEQKLTWEQISRIAMAGNTTMIHLLMNYPCNGLGSVPFTPYNNRAVITEGNTLFPKLHEKTEVLIYPGISAFVGGDIVSGICALHMEKEAEVHMLIDLGTNGEMVLGNREKLLVTSTAAGPAFEGGNITWGTGSVPGAVCHARMEDDILKIRTIQEQPPVGICGTGVLELAAELVKSGKVDETGKLGEPWFQTGYPVAAGPNGQQICLTQRDIREIQLAKAAVRAGIETLLYQYGISAEKVAEVYVAGGFGYRLDYEKAMTIGMFPKAFDGKIKAVGNSSLHGAAELLLHRERIKEAQEVTALSEEISLSTDPVFQDAYIESMLFETES